MDPADPAGRPATAGARDHARSLQELTSVASLRAETVVSKQLPLIVPMLALGIFLMCTTEFLVAGLLPQMSSDLAVGPSRIGLLVTAFAVGMIVGAPIMAVATLRLPHRLTLVLALLVFAAGHVIAACTSQYA